MALAYIDSYYSHTVNAGSERTHSGHDLQRLYLPGAIVPVVATYVAVTEPFGGRCWRC